MTSPADANSPSPAHREADSVWWLKFALGVAAFILIVELALPGFLAAGFSKAGGGRLYVHAFGWSVAEFRWTDTTGAPSGAFRVAGIVLSPALWLMNHSKPTCRFYMWEFHLAGGQEVVYAD